MTKKTVKDILEQKSAEQQTVDVVDHSDLMRMISAQYEIPSVGKPVPIKSIEFVKRIIGMTHMQSYYAINGTKPHIIAFKLYDTNIHQEITYGFLYAFDTRDISPEILKTMNDSKFLYGNYSFAFFNFSYSYQSCDGEYRPSLIGWKHLANAMKKYYNIIHDIEDYIKLIYRKRNWSLFTNHYASEKRDMQTDIIQIIKTEGYPTLFLACIWFIVMKDHIAGYTVAHMNSLFKEIFFAYMPEDSEFYNSLVDKYGADRLSFLYFSITSNVQQLSPTEAVITRVGFKMVPLNIRETNNPFDLRFKTWREYLIGIRLNDGLLNNIISTVPMTVFYMYLRNGKKGLFDNRTQYDKMKNSEIAIEIKKELEHAALATYFVSVDDNNTLMRAWINNKFKALKEKIDIPINYALEEIIMSEDILILLTENIGRTFADLLSLSFVNTEVNTNLGKPLSDAGYPVFAKLIFEVIYSLYVLNKRFGIIHTDLHLNNATIGRLYGYSPDTHHTTIAYNLNNETYSFNNCMWSGCVIDFSRACIHPDFYDDYIDKNVTESHLTNDIEILQEYDRKLLLNLYIQLFPNKSKKREEYSVIFKTYYDKIFHLMTAVDVYMFSTRMIKIISDRVISRKAMDLIVALHKESETYLTKEINDLCENPVDYKIPEKLPNELFIEKHFKEFSGKISPDIIVKNITDVNNPFTYTFAKNLPRGIRTYETMGVDGKITENKAQTSERQRLIMATHDILVENYSIIKDAQLSNYIN